MSDRIILDLAKPILRTWSSESHLMSMILTQENAMDWIYNNYINLHGITNLQIRHISLALFPNHDPTTRRLKLNAWTGCPFLDVHFVSPSYIQNKYSDILEYIMVAIEEGYYLYFSLRQERLTTRMGTQTHKTFIYGFDKNKRRVYIADHYDNSKYVHSEITFDEFMDAYKATYASEEIDIHLLKMDKKNLFENQQIIIAKTKSYKYNFNIDWFQLQLKDYLMSTYSLDSVVAFSESSNKKQHFGIGCYEMISDYLVGLIQNKKTLERDWRVFTLLCDHKKLLKMRAEYFRKKGICSINSDEIKEYNSLSESAEIVLALFLKYLISGENKCLSNMQKRVNDMKEIEMGLLYELQNKLK